MSKGWEAHLKRQAEQKEARTTELLSWKRGELVAVLLEVFNRVRLDENDNDTTLPGVFEAAAMAMIALLDGPAPVDDTILPNGKPLQNPAENAANREHNEVAERLSAVALGARLQVKDQGEVGLLRELIPLVEAVFKSETIASAQKASMFAKTLEKRFPGRVVDPAQVALGLQQTSMSYRVGTIAIAAGVLVTKRTNGKIAPTARTREPGRAEQLRKQANRYDIGSPSDRKRAATRVNEALRKQKT